MEWQWVDDAMGRNQRNAELLQANLEQSGANSVQWVSFQCHKSFTNMFYNSYFALLRSKTSVEQGAKNTYANYCACVTSVLFNGLESL